jgi:hypothetical protein
MKFVCLFVFLIINLSLLVLADVRLYFEKFPSCSTNLTHLCFIVLNEIVPFNIDINEVCSNPKNTHLSLGTLNQDVPYYVVKIDLINLSGNFSNIESNELSDKFLTKEVFQDVNDFKLVHVSVDTDKNIIKPILALVFIAMFGIFHIKIVQMKARSDAALHRNNELMELKTLVNNGYIFLANEMQKQQDVVAFENEPVCSICMVNKPRIVHFPCGHCCLCVSCASNDKSGKCSICREAILTSVILFV